MSNEADSKTQQALSDYIKSLPEPSADMKLMAEAGATYIRHRLGLPPKDARYVLARFVKPFIQAKWFGMGGREIGVASFEDIEEKWSTELYDIPEKVDPFEVLLLRFEPIKDTPAFDAGRCFTWSIGTDEVAVCQVLSAQVMEVFKSTDPFTSRRIVGFARLDLPAAQPDAVNEKGVGITYKTREPIPAREPNQLQVYQQLNFPILDDVKGIEPGELSRATFGEQLHQDLDNARAEEDKAVFADITKPQSMLKCGSEKCAEAFAKERGQLYGHSTLDGCWYVGTHTQLKKIGVFATSADLLDEITRRMDAIPISRNGVHADDTQQNLAGKAMEDLPYPAVNTKTSLWYGTGCILPMGPIAAVIDSCDRASGLVRARVLCRVFLRYLGVDSLLVDARVYAKPNYLPEDSYGWFAERVLRWQGIPTTAVTVSTFNLSGVKKLSCSSVVYDEVQDVTPELINQVMTNTSTLPTISKEERALLDAADKVMEVLEGGDIGYDEVCAYRKAEANFMATRKEF